MTEPEQPQAAVIEIIDRRDPDNYGIIAPQEVRINGATVLTSGDRPIIVHETVINSGDVVMVTMTLFAKRVFIGNEDDLPA